MHFQINIYKILGLTAYFQKKHVRQNAWFIGENIHAWRSHGR